MPYDKPGENDAMTTEYLREDLPKPPKADAGALQAQQIELDLI